MSNEIRLIDANALRDEVLYDNTYDNNTVNYYLGLIDDAPTIEPKRGRWERIINAYGELEGFMCKCGCQSGSAPSYCPSCGSRMVERVVA